MSGKARAVGLSAALLACVAGSVCAYAWMRAPAPPVARGLRSYVEAAASSLVKAPEPVVSASAAPRAKKAPKKPRDDSEPTSLEGQREVLLALLRDELDVPDDKLAAIKAIFDASKYLGQGNPKVSKHGISRKQCREIRESRELAPMNDPICGLPHMVPLYDPTRGETPKDAPACIDQFEFPGVPCEFPVVFPRSNEAAQLCELVGKRICDAHEWEGGCAGSLRPIEVEYQWDKARPHANWYHNRSRPVTWAYGPKKKHAICGTGAKKSPKCEAGGFSVCGSNTYPSGSFPDCVSPLGVYDQHGNVAEHMNFPASREELASLGGKGQTEMKGSWFIFAELEAHEDDCRWRAKDWHPSTLMAEDSHRNYHLGFRCCKNAEP